MELHEFAPGRPSLVARLRGTEDLKPLVFTGNLDVVPLSVRHLHSADPAYVPVRFERALSTAGHLFGRDLLLASPPIRLG